MGHKNQVVEGTGAQRRKTYEERALKSRIREEAMQQKGLRKIPYLGQKKAGESSKPQPRKTIFHIILKRSVEEKSYVLSEVFILQTEYCVKVGC